MELYGYYRSSAAFRVRIALNLKGLGYDIMTVNLVPGTDEQKSATYLSLNPQGRVPCLVDGDICLSQSPAIIEYLEETYPTPAFLPAGPVDRARVRQMAALVACDIHPLNNLSVLQYLKGQLRAGEEAVQAWYAHWIREGFKALEQLVVAGASFCFGDTLTLADIYLVPQMWNARRFNVPLDDFPNLNRIDAHCQTLDAFSKAAPENQPDKPDTFS